MGHGHFAPGNQLAQTHGHAGYPRDHIPPSPTYHSWQAMKRRVTYSDRHNWAQYGGKGVVVCDRWQSFEAFLADMGERPEGMTLDRIDSSGNYEPGNVRWADQKTQSANRRFQRKDG